MNKQGSPGSDAQMDSNSKSETKGKKEAPKSNAGNSGIAIPKLKLGGK